MVKLSISRILILLISIAFLFQLNGCHSKYLNSSIEFSDHFAWKPDGSAFAFLAIKSLYRRPEGISTFPDGGRSVSEYYDVALYYFNIKDNRLNRVVDFNDVSPLYSKTTLKFIHMAFVDSLLYYKLGKPFDIDIKSAKKRAQTKEGSFRLSALIEKASKPYAYNINTHKPTEVDPATFNAAFSQAKSIEYNRKLGRAYLEKLPLADWGIRLQDIYPQSKETYMKYIIYQKGDPKVRDAIFEQIIPKFTKRQIQKMLKDMDAYKAKIDKKYESSLDYNDQFKKSSYDKYYEPTCKRLQKFL